MAEIGGVSKRTYCNYEAGDREPTSDFLIKIANAEADVEYILTGNPGKPRRLAALKKATEDVAKLPISDDDKLRLRDILFSSEAGNYELLAELLNAAKGNNPVPASNQSEYHEIPHYNIQAAAGSGAIPVNEEQLKPLAFRRDWLAKRHLSPASLVIVDVRGDSMEPKLQDGDLVLVDTSQTDIANGKTYVLRMDGHLLVKNLQRIPHGLVLVSSFNAGFSPYEADLCDESLDMAVIGRVVASMHEW